MLAESSSIDWAHLIEVVAIAITAILAAWNKIVSDRRDRKIDKIGEIVVGTEAVMDGQKMAVLRTGLISAKALVAADPTQENIQLSKEASKQFDQHLTEQAAKESAKLENKL